MGAYDPTPHWHHRGEYKSQLLALPEAEALQRLSAELRGAKQKMEQQQVQLEQLDPWTPA